MPFAAKHPCSDRGCRALTDGRFCCEHQVGPEVGHRWDTDRRPVKRLRGRQLQARRVDLFRREPWCRRCAAQGRRVKATIRDHIVNLRDGGTEDEANVQPLCQTCSDAKTVEESQRGRYRQGGGM
jgi:5-methylcytosine-specific restriction protein A